LYTSQLLAFGKAYLLILLFHTHTHTRARARARGKNSFVEGFS